MAKNNHSLGRVWQFTSKSSPKTVGLYKVSLFDHIKEKVDALYQEIDNLSITPSAPVPPTHVAPATLYCEIHRINKHATNDCKMILTEGSIQDNVNFMKK